MGCRRAGGSCQGKGRARHLKQIQRSRRRRPFFEGLEGRQLLSATPNVAADTSQLVFGDVVDAKLSAARTVTFTNSGQTPVTVFASGISITGDVAGQFYLSAAPTDDVILAPGDSLGLAVAFSATTLGPQGATLQLNTDDADNPLTSVTLRGLGTQGEQGNLEPSLQWILDTYQIGVRTGDLDPGESTLDLTPGPNDEVIASLFTKAGDGPVTITPIAAYTNATTPALTLGYYTKASPTATLARTQLYTVPAADVQTLNPHVVGNSSFDPGTATFGLYSTWAAQNNRTVYSEDFRNTFIANPALQRMFKVYPLMNADGTVVPNAYVVGNEEANNHDYQDAVYIITNVAPAQTFPVPPPPQVSGLTLVNADTGKDVGPLTDGGTIDFSQTGTKRLSIRAIVNGTPVSVKFAVAGGFTHTDAGPLFTMNGDTGTTYTAWIPTTGVKVLTVTPYSAANATGTAGTAMTVSFTVTNGAPVSPPVVPPPPVSPPPVSPPPVSPPPVSPPPVSPPPVSPPPVSPPPVSPPPVSPPPVSPPPVSPPPVSPPPPVTTPVVYQAESAKLVGATAAKDNAGYSGSGYADFQNAAGDSINWSVSSASGGSVKLTFRYANGGTANRPLSLVVNGVTINPSLAFNSTGSWATWKTVTITVQLAAGANSIMLSTIGSNGGNIDSLTVG